jgi:hypothetical protein
LSNNGKAPEVASATNSFYIKHTKSLKAVYGEVFMSEYVQNLVAQVKAKNSNEPEFHQAVEEVVGSLELVLARHPSTA